jgi:nucleoside-diphosphate-sugar epimerase
MRALVTGCAGFIGSHLTEFLLEKGFEVTGIDCLSDNYPRPIKERNLSVAMEHENFIFIKEDLNKIDAFPEVEYIFHLAAQAGVRSSWGDHFRSYVRNNIEATQKILEFYKDQPIRKFVYSSSSSVYGDAEIPETEDLCPMPLSPYGVSKLAAEHLCQLYGKNFDLPVICLRYFTVYGPRQRPDMAMHQFWTALVQGYPIHIYGDGSQTRDFTYIGDILRANWQAAMSASVGEVYNIGGGHRIRIIDLIDKMAFISGKERILRYCDYQKGDVKDTHAETAKARREIGWKPEIDIDTGLARYFESFIRQYHRQGIENTPDPIDIPCNS